MRQRLLDDRMASAGDRKSQTVVDLGAHIIPLDRENSQRRRDIDDGERVRRRLDRGARRGDAGGQAIEDFELERQGALGGVGDLGFKFAELRGGKAHLPGERLPMDERRIERRRQ
jgi:hypothetical protein